MSLSSLKGNLISLDTETTGTNPYGSFRRYGFYPARPFSYSFCDSVGNTAYVRFEVDPKTRMVIPNPRKMKQIEEITRDPDIVKIGHNLSFDIRMSRMFGIDFDWTSIEDSMIISHVVTGGSLPSYALKPLGERWLDISSKDQEDLIETVHEARKVAVEKGWCIATEETHSKQPYKADYWLGDRVLNKRYNIQDSVRSMLIYLAMRERMDKDERLVRTYDREMELVRVIYNMEQRGVRVFREHLGGLEKYYSNYRKKWKRRATKAGGAGMNFNSPKQMIQKFIVEKKYKPLAWSDELKKSNPFFPDINRRKNPKVDSAFLAYARDFHGDDLAKCILEYKAGHSMGVKFIKPYQKFMVKEDHYWVLHPNFRQVGTSTGRLSCADPNLMQVAAEKDIDNRLSAIGLKPREAIGARKNCIWYLPDYSQMEVWVFAFQANSMTMMRALLNGEDFHTVTAQQVWGDEPDWITNMKSYRKKGKIMMFLKQYGGGVDAVMKLVGCSRLEAIDIISKFDSRLPDVNEFLTRMSSEAERKGFIYNPFGRKYIIPRGQTYKAVNYLVQGTCADLMKNAMLNVDKMLNTKYKGCRLLLTLHDELVIEVPKRLHSTQLQNDLEKEMQRDSAIAGIPVPLPITFKFTSTRWSFAE